MLPFVEDIDAGKIHVREPYDVVFLCGGECSSIGDPNIRSLRDAFHKALPNPAMEFGEWLMAEDVTGNFDFFANYSDVLVFETDIAQIVKLIVLFCESEGSLAELGAFTAIDEILKRLFVVVRHKHWTQNSFIKLGPLRRIEHKLGREAIQVITDEDIEISGKEISTVNKQALAELLRDPLIARLNAPREPTTLDPTRAGHIIKLIVGLAQEYAALTFKEIFDTLKLLNINKSEDDIKGYLLCACAVSWLSIVSRGGDDYYIPNSRGEDAATFHMRDEAKEKIKIRRRVKIREYWREKDKQRHGAIKSTAPQALS